MSLDPGSSTRARIITHPFETAIAVIFTVMGAGMTLSGFHLVLTNLAVTLPDPLVAAWAMALLVGGPLIFVGVVYGGRPAVGRAIEKGGHWLAIAVWCTYAITIASLHSDKGGVAIATALAFVAGCAGRIYALRRLGIAEDKIRKIQVG